MSGAFPLFEESLRTSGLFPLTATGIAVFQINVGKLHWEHYSRLVSERQ